MRPIIRRMSGRTICCGLMLLLAPHLYAEIAEPLSLDLVARRVSGLEMSGVDFSPNGEWLAYVVVSASDARAPERGGYSSSGVPTGDTMPKLVLFNTKTGESLHPSADEASSWAPAWSPNGNQLAFLSDAGGQARIWIWDRKQRRTTAVTESIARPYRRAEALQWTSDGKRILARILPAGMTLSQANSRPAAARAANGPAGGKADADSAPVWVLRTHRAEDKVESNPWLAQNPSDHATEGELVEIDPVTKQITRLASRMQVRWYDFSPDDRYVAFTVLLDRKPGANASARYDLMVYDRAEKTSKVIAGDLPLNGFACTWSPRATALACVLARTERAAVAYVANELVVVSVADGTIRKLADNIEMIAGMSGGQPPRALWNRDGTSLYIVGTDEPRNLPAKWYSETKHDRLWRVDLKSSRASVVADLPGEQITGLISADQRTLLSKSNGRMAWLLAKDSGRRSGTDSLTGLYSVDLQSGQAQRQLDISAGWPVVGAVSASAGTVAYAADTLQSPPDLWTFDLKSRHVHQVTRLNPEWARVSLGTSEVLTYRDSAGRQLRSGLLLPPGYEHDRKLPLVVFAFGMPHDSANINNFGISGNTGSYNMHVLATRGYAVLNPDMPLRMGVQMKDVLDTITPAVDAAIARGYVDPDRLAVMGYSFGSYTALSLVLQTDRFKAAVLGGVTVPPDLFAAYLFMTPISDNPDEYDDQAQALAMGGSPWQYRQRFVDNSPATYFDRLHTPILIGQGTADRLLVSDTIFGALKRLDKDVEYRIYLNEDHSISRAPNIIDFWQRRVEFLDERLNINRDSQGRMQFRNGLAVPRSLPAAPHE